MRLLRCVTAQACSFAGKQNFGQATKKRSALAVLCVSTSKALLLGEAVALTNATPALSLSLSFYVGIQVVLQDLATQEVRRIRRKQNDPPTAASGQTGAGTAKSAKGQRDAVGGGDAEVEAQAATPAPASTANGAKPLAAARENGKAGPLGVIDKSGKKKLSAKGGGGGGGDGLRGEGRAATTPKDAAAGTPKQKPNGVTVQSADRSMDSAAVPGSCTTATSAAESVSSSSVRRKESAAAALIAPPTIKNPAVSSPPEALQGIETVGGDRVGVAGSAWSRTGGGGEGNSKPEPMDEEGGEDEERKDGESVRANGKGKAKEEEREGRGRGGRGLSASKTRSVVQCPAHALSVARTFFDYSSVSSFEMRMLPEFFTGRSASKTPEVGLIWKRRRGDVRALCSCHL